MGSDPKVALSSSALSKEIVDTVETEETDETLISLTKATSDDIAQHTLTKISKDPSTQHLIQNLITLLDDILALNNNDLCVHIKEVYLAALTLNKANANNEH